MNEFRTVLGLGEDFIKSLYERFNLTTGELKLVLHHLDDMVSDMMKEDAELIKKVESMANHYSKA